MPRLKNPYFNNLFAKYDTELEVSFFDFSNLAKEEKEKVESILASKKRSVQLPWKESKSLPVKVDPPMVFNASHVVQSQPCPMMIYHPQSIQQQMIYAPQALVYNHNLAYIPMHGLGAYQVHHGTMPMHHSMPMQQAVNMTIGAHSIFVPQQMGATTPTQYHGMHHHMAHQGQMMMEMTSMSHDCHPVYMQQQPSIDSQPVQHAPVLVSTDYASAAMGWTPKETYDVTTSVSFQSIDASGADTSQAPVEELNVVEENDLGAECEDVVLPAPSTSGEANEPSSDESSKHVKERIVNGTVSPDVVSEDISASRPSTIDPVETTIANGNVISESIENDPENANGNTNGNTSGDVSNDSSMVEVHDNHVVVNDAKMSASEVKAKPKVTSWASLLRDTASANNAIVINSANDFPAMGKSSDQRKQSFVKDRDMPPLEPPKPIESEDEMKRKLSNILKGHKVSHRSAFLQPRGLANHANWCYVNATLQALLACPPFYHLIKLLPPLDGRFWDKNNLPVMKCLLKFVNEFSALPVKALEKQAINSKGTMKQDIKCGPSFEPVYVYKMLQAIDYEAFKHNQQEDAEEFLSCILNRLHDEMVAAIKLTNAAASSEIKNSGLANGSNGQSLDGHRSLTGEEAEDNTRWEQVRSRNRTVFNSTADTESSPISSIFRGQICCILHQAGQKESATLQPFFTLQLDVQSDKVRSVQEALEQLVSKESLLGYTCTKSKVEVDATQRMMIEDLPPVLVLHLKWFIYDKNGGIQKCIKQVDFDVDLELSKDLLSNHAKLQKNQRKYKLFAVVNHIGARAIGGHYTVDVFHSGYNSWIRCDDNNITSIPVSAVTKFCAPKVPYLIFYRRLDAS